MCMKRKGITSPCLRGERCYFLKPKYYVRLHRGLTSKLKHYISHQTKYIIVGSTRHKSQPNLPRVFNFQKNMCSGRGGNLKKLEKA